MNNHGKACRTAVRAMALTSIITLGAAAPLQASVRHNLRVREVQIEPGNGASQIMVQNNCPLVNLATVIRINHLKAPKYLVRLDRGELALPSSCPARPVRAVAAASHQIIQQIDRTARHHHRQPVHHGRHHRNAAHSQIQITQTPPVQASTPLPIQPQIRTVTMYKTLPLALTIGLGILTLLLAALSVYLYRELRKYQPRGKTIRLGKDTWKVHATYGEVQDNGSIMWFCDCPWGQNSGEEACREHRLHFTDRNIREHLITKHEALTKVRHTAVTV